MSVEYEVCKGCHNNKNNFCVKYGEHIERFIGMVDRCYGDRMNLKKMLEAN